MCFLLLLPVVQCFLFCLCIGRDPRGLKVAVVNEEVQGISSCDWLPTEGCNFSLSLSCRYLKKLQQKTYKLVRWYSSTVISQLIFVFDTFSLSVDRILRRRCSKNRG